MKIGLLFIALIIILCSSNPMNKSASLFLDFLPNSKVVKDTIYNKSKFNLYASDIYFEVEVTRIELIEKKGGYKIQSTQYAVPDTISAFIPSISFKITNTNNKEYLAPIPESYELIGKNESRSTYRSSLYKTEDGRGVHNFSKGLCDNNGKYVIEKHDTGGILLRFKPFESKEFKVNFDPIPSEIEVVNLKGFHLEYKPPRRGDLYTAKLQEVWFLIDLKKRKVIGRNFPFNQY